MDKVTIDCDTVVTVGSFDGVHKGHQKLFDAVLQISKLNNLKSVIFTYSNHPMAFVTHKEVKYLTEIKERDELLKKIGTDIVLSLPFDETIMNMTSEEFITDILVKKLHCKFLIIGENAVLGKNGTGNGEVLKRECKKHGIEFISLPLLFIDGKKVSSTAIRNMIMDGDIEGANLFLGRPYLISGEVVHGEQNGRKIGYPTANIRYIPNLVVPSSGVYAVIVELENKKYVGACNVGTNPTVSDNKTIKIEVHIIGYEGNLYGKNIRLYFIKKIRNECKFDSMDYLMRQITSDKSTIIEIMKDKRYTTI